MAKRDYQKLATEAKGLLLKYQQLKKSKNEYIFEEQQLEILRALARGNIRMLSLPFLKPYNPALLSLLPYFSLVKEGEEMRYLDFLAQYFPKTVYDFMLFDPGDRHHLKNTLSCKKISDIKVNNSLKTIVGEMGNLCENNKFAIGLLERFNHVYNEGRIQLRFQENIQLNKIPENIKAGYIRINEKEKTKSLKKKFILSVFGLWLYELIWTTNDKLAALLSQTNTKPTAKTLNPKSPSKQESANPTISPSVSTVRSPSLGGSGTNQEQSMSTSSPSDSPTMSPSSSTTLPSWEDLGTNQEKSFSASSPPSASPTISPSSSTTTLPSSEEPSTDQEQNMSNSSPSASPTISPSSSTSTLPSSGDLGTNNEQKMSASSPTANPAISPSSLTITLPLLEESGTNLEQNMGSSSPTASPAISPSSSTTILSSLEESVTNNKQSIESSSESTGSETSTPSESETESETSLSPPLSPSSAHVLPSLPLTPSSTDKPFNPKQILQREEFDSLVQQSSPSFFSSNSSDRRRKPIRQWGTQRRTVHDDLSPSVAGVPVPENLDIFCNNSSLSPSVAKDQTEGVDEQVADDFGLSPSVAGIQETTFNHHASSDCSTSPGLSPSVPVSQQTPFHRPSKFFSAPGSISPSVAVGSTFTTDLDLSPSIGIGQTTTYHTIGTIIFTTDPDDENATTPGLTPGR